MLPAPPWLLVADDLTGACDAAAAFALHGFSTEVVWGRAAALDSPAELLAVSTETRESGDAEAAAAVGRIVRGAGRRLVYKKIDSVLRGPVAAELAAAREAAGSERVALCPALPEQGRTVRGGRVFAGDEPLAAQLPNAGWIDVFDAATPGDLERIAADLTASGALPAGSAGLAWAWAAELGRRFGRRFANPPLPPVSAPIAVVAGSHHPATLAQVDYLQEVGGVQACPIERLEEAAPGDHLIVLEMRTADETTFAPLGRAAHQGSLGGVIATGGATARVMLESFRSKSLNLRGEVDRGVPWSIIQGGAADGLPLVTKSGGFGAPDFLARIVRGWPRTCE